MKTLQVFEDNCLDYDVMEEMIVQFMGGRGPANDSYESFYPLPNKYDSEKAADLRRRVTKILLDDGMVIDHSNENFYVLINYSW